MTGPVLAEVAAKAPLDRIQAAIPAARRAAAEGLAGIGPGLPLGEDLGAALVVAFALALIRIEDLGGGEALTERFGRTVSGDAGSLALPTPTDTPP